MCLRALICRMRVAKHIKATVIALCDIITSISIRRARCCVTESAVTEAIVRFGGVTAYGEDLHAKAVFGQARGVLRNVTEPDEAHGLALQHRHRATPPVPRASRPVALQPTNVFVEMQGGGHDVFGQRGREGSSA